ncbi:MAG: sulfatase [Verrucomicrobiae bacterium]|nr:sulfatase [Verrucomicrobiae bacterium]
MRRRLIILPCLLAGLTLFSQAEETRPPNFILIFADDLGYADLGCFGAKDFETPNLDRMAKEGAKLTNFYVPASVCSASRAALLTGCYPDRVGITGVLFPTRAKDDQPAGPGTTGLNPDEITIAETLKTKDYATACIGKWHLGDDTAFLPTKQGFDEYFGIPYSNDMGWWRGKPKDFKKDFPPIPLLEDESIIETNPDQRYLTRRYTERAVQFIRQHREDPFFLYLPHTMPHVPLFVSEPFSGSADYGLYGDVIEELDWSMGVILNAIAEAGLDENTWVIFTSDNGPWLSMGAHGGHADPLRDGKFTRFEGGHRVPCVMRWPGHIPPGLVLDDIVSTIDFLPTFAGLAGASLPEDRKIDGMDVWPYLSGRVASSPRDTFFYSPWVVRSSKWKLMMPGKYKEIYPAPEKSTNGMVDYSHPQLYNLASDPGETTSLHQESKYAELIKTMSKLCTDYQEALKTEARPVGHVMPPAD